MKKSIMGLMLLGSVTTFAFDSDCESAINHVADKGKNVGLTNYLLVKAENPGKQLVAAHAVFEAELETAIKVAIIHCNN